MTYCFSYGTTLEWYPLFSNLLRWLSDQTQVARLLSKLNERKDFFATQNMRRDIIDGYNQYVKVPKNVLVKFTEHWPMTAAASDPQREVDGKGDRFYGDQFCTMQYLIYLKGMALVGLHTLYQAWEKLCESIHYCCLVSWCHHDTLGERGTWGTQEASLQKWFND